MRKRMVWRRSGHGQNDCGYKTELIQDTNMHPTMDTAGFSSRVLTTMWYVNIKFKLTCLKFWLTNQKKLCR